ncbi:hypothetical protein CDD82_2190 [Ophiocordyceps australis]|uniref:Uncharacterized protein n=1 Tax=Ophiocordyceps australis TaxID=1399860 RepID=A0A2C5XFT7_9HYPO|nr:hypothetical protein CDD82_2190 [Ophiocordyceps australis]
MRILLDSNFQDDLNKCLNYHDEFKNTPVAEQMHTIMRMSEKIARFVQQFQSQYGAIFLTNTTSPGVMGKYQDHVSVMCHCAKVLTSTMANRAGAWEKELENASTEAKYDSEEVFEQIQRIEEDQRIRKREEMARDERQKQREEEIKRLEWDLEFKHASIDAAEKKVKKAEEKVQQAEARVQKTEKDIKIEVERRVEAVREETIREAAEIVLRELAEEEIEDAHHGPSHSAAPTSAEELTSPRSVTPRSLGRISAGARKAKEKIAELRKENRNIVYEKGQLEERLQEGKAKQEVWNKTEREYKRQIKLKQTQIDRKQIDIQALQANMQAKEKGYDALQEKYMADREKLEQAYNALRDQVDSDEAKRILAARKRQDEKQANTNKASAPPRGSPPQTRQKDPDAPQLHDRSTSASPQLAADSNFSLANELGEDWETFGTSSLVDEPLDVPLGDGGPRSYSQPRLLDTIYKPG